MNNPNLPLLNRLTDNPDHAGNGVQYAVSGDGEITGNFYAIDVITDTIFTSIELGSSSSGAANLVGDTIPERTRLYGPFTKVELTSGLVCLLKIVA